MCLINLQSTEKDTASSIRIFGKCDEIMEAVFKKLNIVIPCYDPLIDFVKQKNTLQFGPKLVNIYKLDEIRTKTEHNELIKKEKDEKVEIKIAKSKKRDAPVPIKDKRKKSKRIKSETKEYQTNEIIETESN